jgi:hypothetical protein
MKPAYQFICIVISFQFLILFGVLFGFDVVYRQKNKNKLHGLGPRAKYTDRATAASRRSDYQLLRIKGAMWSA